MYRVLLSGRAIADLNRMYYYIAKAGFPENALTFTDRVTNFCQTLCTFPHRGVRRFDLQSGLRIVSFNGQAIVAFQVREAPKEVLVLRILRKGQNLEKYLKR